LQGGNSYGRDALRNRQLSGTDGGGVHLAQGAEMSVTKEFVCSECHHLSNSSTGEIVKGWEKSYFVSVIGDRVCKACKETIIQSLEKAMN
jgi:hypothetical protein